MLSLIPLILAALFARAVWKRRGALSRSIAVLELSAKIIMQHPALLLLSLVGLVAYLLLSIPILTIFARLFLVGHYEGKSEGWHTDSSARGLAWLTLGVWLWTWSVLRGIQRVTVAGTVSHWYFHRSQDLDEETALPGHVPGAFDSDALSKSWLGKPTSLEIVRAAFARATGPAIGTICASAFVLAATQLAAIVANNARRTSRWIAHRHPAGRAVSIWLQPIAHVAAILAGLSVLLQGVSNYVLIYVGITGESFSVASKRSARLAGLGGIRGVLDGLIIDLVLDLTALAFSLLAGIAAFLFSAHQLHQPADAPLVGLLSMLLSYGILRLCADTLNNACVTCSSNAASMLTTCPLHSAETLYLCYAIDRAADAQHCDKAAQAVSPTLLTSCSQALTLLHHSSKPKTPLEISVY